jgi:hypothetical protein
MEWKLILRAIERIWICCKTSLTTKDIVAHPGSSILWNVAKIFFATDPVEGLCSATRRRYATIRASDGGES